MKMKKIPICQVLSSRLHLHPNISGELLKRKNGVAFAMILALSSTLVLPSNRTYAGVMVPLVPDIFVLGSGAEVNNAFSASANIAILEDTTAMAVSTSDTAKASASISDNVYLNYLKAVDAYAQQVLQYQEQVLQVEMMIKDLEEKPLEVIVPDANQLIANQKKIDQLAQDIASNSSNIAANLMNDLEHPDTVGLGQGSRFALWSEARRKSSEESYKVVTDFAKDNVQKNKEITQSIKNIDHAVDKTATLKAMAQASGQQLSWLQQMATTLNQLLGARAIENGTTYSERLTSAEALQKFVTDPPGSHLKFTPDTYKGPGKSSGKGF